MLLFGVSLSGFSCLNVAVAGGQGFTVLKNGTVNSLYIRLSLIHRIVPHGVLPIHIVTFHSEGEG